MKLKRKFVLLSLLFMFLFCLNAVSAIDANETDVNNTDNSQAIDIDIGVENPENELQEANLTNDVVKKENVKIKADNMNTFYDSGEKYKVKVVDMKGKALKGVTVKVKLYTGSKYKLYKASTNVNGLSSFKFSKLSCGKHKLEINIDNNKYTAGTVKKNLKIDKAEPYVLCSDDFIVNTNKYFKVRVYDLNLNYNLKYIKNLKLTVKVKIGKKTKTYKVKTNSKGFAKILNVKKLKVGTYKVTVKSSDKHYKVADKGVIGIYSKTKRTITLKMGSTKKIRNGDVIEAYYSPKDGQNSKGVYAYSWNFKNPLDGISHSFITKTKFFFKNKKTGKIITKTVKLKTDSFYGWKPIKGNLIKGYVPVKAKIWYSVNK